MTENELENIVSNAQMIVCGYAFTQNEDGFMHVVNIHAPHHALVMTNDGEVLETNMDDIEISIVRKYWYRNKNIVEKA